MGSGWQSSWATTGWKERRAFSRQRWGGGVLGQGQQGKGPEVEPTWLVKVELATEESRCDG